MRRIFSCLMVGFLLVSLFSVNVFAYTVDDIRDLVGKERVDDRFTQEEMDMVIQQYENIERENMMLKMFAIGKEIDLDSGLIAKYDALEKELELAIDVFGNAFEGGKPIAEVLKSKSKVESILHKIDSLRDIGYEVDVEYIPNIWTEKYEEVQEVINEMSTFYNIGEIGQEMLVPYLGTFKIYSAYGPRLNKFTYDTVENHHGIDFELPLDTMVLSQWSGVVSKIYTTEHGGKTIEISHGTNLKTVYSHLGEILVVVGENVSQYEGIARTGNTGKMVVPHLHFEVILDGSYINPIYLYGEKALAAFQTYASTYASEWSKYHELKDSIKSEPSKIVPEEEEKVESVVMFVEQPGFSLKNFQDTYYSRLEEEENKMGERVITNTENDKNIENNSE